MLVCPRYSPQAPRNLGAIAAAELAITCHWNACTTQMVWKAQRSGAALTAINGARAMRTQRTPPRSRESLEAERPIAGQLPTEADTVILGSAGKPTA